MASKSQQIKSFFMFSALADIQLNLYRQTARLNTFDPDLLTKFKNLKASFERATKKAYGMFDEKDQLVFFDLINIFEALIQSAVDEKDFSELLSLIKAYQNKEITIINSNEELVKAADGLRMEEVGEETTN
jgi:hypothetical protein